MNENHNVIVDPHTAIGIGVLGKLSNDDIIEKVVALVEKKSEELKNIS